MKPRPVTQSQLSSRPTDKQLEIILNIEPIFQFFFSREIFLMEGAKRKGHISIERLVSFSRYRPEGRVCALCTFSAHVSDRLHRVTGRRINSRDLPRGLCMFTYPSILFPTICFFVHARLIDRSTRPLELHLRRALLCALLSTGRLRISDNCVLIAARVESSRHNVLIANICDASRA